MYGYIYISTNRVNGHKYIGRKVGPFISSYKGSGVVIKNAFKKYGKSYFDVEILSEAEDEEDLIAKEIYYIDLHNAVKRNDFYNLCSGGRAWGSPTSLSTKIKISESNRGKDAWNKGLPNEIARKRMISNNPMKDSLIVRKVSQSLKGHEPHNKINETFIWKCEHCEKEKELRDTVSNRNHRFCNKSCAAKWSNYNRKDRIGCEI